MLTWTARNRTAGHVPIAIVTFASHPCKSMQDKCVWKSIYPLRDTCDSQLVGYHDSNTPSSQKYGFFAVFGSCSSQAAKLKGPVR